MLLVAALMAIAFTQYRHWLADVVLSPSLHLLKRAWQRQPQHRQVVPVVPVAFGQSFARFVPAPKPDRPYRLRPVRLC